MFLIYPVPEVHTRISVSKKHLIIRCSLSIITYMYSRTGTPHIPCKYSLVRRHVIAYGTSE